MSHASLPLQSLQPLQSFYRIGQPKQHLDQSAVYTFICQHLTKSQRSRNIAGTN